MLTRFLIEVLPPKEVATMLDDVTSRVFKLVENTLGDGVTSWSDMRGLIVITSEARKENISIVVVIYVWSSLLQC